MTAHSRVIICAGNARQAQDYARARGLAPSAWVYAASPGAIRGLDGDVQIVRVGTWYAHRDAAEIDGVLAELEARMDAAEKLTDHESRIFFAGARAEADLRRIRRRPLAELVAYIEALDKGVLWQLKTDHELMASIRRVFYPTRLERLRDGARDLWRRALGGTWPR